jgi:hypothetical protein
MKLPIRIPGLCYATGTGDEILPVIDLTHPAFAIKLDAAALEQMTRDHLWEEERRHVAMRWWPRWVLWFFVRKSTLLRSLRDANGFLDGMSTYRLKLGPAYFGPDWPNEIDRKIAASLPCLGIRLRLQDMAMFLAASVGPRLAARPEAPLHLVNIAGGPAMDSLNTLLLLRKEQPELLQHRAVRISILDQDEIGPDFAARALAALSEPGAPLAGMDVTLTRVPYRWENTDGLRAFLSGLPAGGVVAVSSEGGLFDYGSDEEILANLATLSETLPPEVEVAGSATRADAPDRSQRPKWRITLRPREPGSFARLVTRVGWAVGRENLRPFSFHVLLRRA